MTAADPFTPSRRTWWQLGAGLLVGVVLAFTIRGCTGPSTPSTSRPGATRTPGPRSVTLGVPVGYAHTRAGARTAAARYVTTGQTMLDAGPASAGDAVRKMAAARTADVQVDEVIGRLAALSAKLAAGTGPVRYWQAALATRLDAYGPRRVRVAVWNVGVLSRRDVAAPQAGWSTSTLQLVWERGDWKVASERVRSGPTPMLNLGAHPSIPDRFTADLHGFDAWPSGTGS
jgi:hypothetical protein